MIEELRSCADWCVSCACGGKSAEVEAAYWAIDEIARLRAENERLREASVSLVKWFRENIGENKGELDDILEALEYKSCQAREALK